MPLDLYLLITQGQYSPSGIINMPAGWTVSVQEEVIVEPVQRPGGSTGVQTGTKEETKRKKIKLKFFKEDKLEFEKEVEVTDITVKVQDVQLNENTKTVKVVLKSEINNMITEMEI